MLGRYETAVEVVVEITGERFRHALLWLEL